MMVKLSAPVPKSEGPGHLHRGSETPTDRARPPLCAPFLAVRPYRMLNADGLCDE